MEQETTQKLGGSGVSSVIRCGIDILDERAFSRAVSVGGERFLHRVFTDRELFLANQRAAKLCIHFTLKEAASKALGTGIRGMRWREIEVIELGDHSADIALHGSAALEAAHLGLTQWLSWQGKHADIVWGFVVALGAEDMIVAATTCLRERVLVIERDISQKLERLRNQREV